MIFAEIFAPVISGKWSKTISLVALLLTASLLLIILIATPISWYKDVKLSKSDVKPQSVNFTANNNIDLIDQIPKLHLFGQAANVSNTGILPVTSLQFNLIGIVEANPAGNSSVIISKAGSPGKVYFVGDKISATITVNAITKDGVILENGGNLEKLPLKRKKLAFRKFS